MDLYGADDFLLKNMEVVEGEIDWQALKTGKYVLLNVECDDNGNMIDNPDVKAGDTVRFNHVSMDGLSSVTDNRFDLIVMAKSVQMRIRLLPEIPAQLGFICRPKIICRFALRRTLSAFLLM